MKTYSKFSDLLGATLTDVTVNSCKDEITLTCMSGGKYRLYHYQDCCENVNIDDICGDLTDLVGTPILMAEESTSQTPPDGGTIDESCLWTFYRLRTIKGTVVIRWYGESDYYSVAVSFEKVAA